MNSSWLFGLCITVFVLGGCTTVSQLDSVADNETIVTVVNDQFSLDVPTLGQPLSATIESYNRRVQRKNRSLVINSQLANSQSMQSYLSSLSAEDAQSIQDWIDSRDPDQEDVLSLIGVADVGDLAYMYDEVGGNFRIYRYAYPNNYLSVEISSLENTAGENEIYRFALEVDVKNYQSIAKKEPQTLDNLLLAEQMWISTLVPSLDYKQLGQVIRDSYQALEDNQSYKASINRFMVSKSFTSPQTLVLLIEPK